MDLQKTARRFAKIMPADFDYWQEFELACQWFVSEKIENTVEKQAFCSAECRLKLGIFIVLIAYGMFELKSSLVALISVKPLLALVTEDDVEAGLKFLEMECEEKK